jgi:hypothetical protein
MIISTHTQFFGPQHPGWKGKPGYPFNFFDTGNTSHTKIFRFGQGFCPISWAEFHVVWIPTSPSQVGQMIQSPTAGTAQWQAMNYFYAQPTGGAYSAKWDCTAPLNQFVLNRIDTVFGFQVCGDGLSDLTMIEVRLTIDWIVGQQQLQLSQQIAKQEAWY